MKEKSLILPDWKIRVLKEATQFRVVMKPQPEIIELDIAPAVSSRILPQKPPPCPARTKVWVKEAFGLVFLATGHPTIGKIPDDADPSEVSVHYKIGASDFEESLFSKWRSARSMPKWASRFTLEITDVRAERLKEISIKDLSAETGLPGSSALSTFTSGWNSTAKLGEKWADSPWVWVNTFKVLEGTHASQE